MNQRQGWGVRHLGEEAVPWKMMCAEGGTGLRHSYKSHIPMLLIYLFKEIVTWLLEDIRPT